MVGAVVPGNLRAPMVMGAGGWILLALANALGLMSISFTQALLSFGLLVIVPLGLDSFVWTQDLAERLRRVSLKLAPLSGLVAAVSLMLPAGILAGILAGSWLLTMTVLGMSALVELVRTRPLRIGVLLRAAGSAYLVVGAGWLLSSRLGARPLGFSDGIVELTAVHFHFAGFAAPLIAALAADRMRTRSVGASHAANIAGLGAIAAMAMVAAGIAASPLLEIIGSGVIGLALSVLGIATLVGARNGPRPSSKALLAISSVSVLAAMALAIQYALGQFAGTPALGIDQMAKTHGSLNAFGFAMCGLLGWRLAHKEIGPS